MFELVFITGFAIGGLVMLMIATHYGVKAFKKLPTEEEIIEKMPVPDWSKMVTLPKPIKIEFTEENTEYLMITYPNSVAHAIRKLMEEKLGFKEEK